MKLPFLQHTGIGLYVTAEAVRWVELARIRERVWLRRYACEPIREGAEGAEAALARLVRRVQPDEPFVATHLPLPYVREHVVDVPHFNDEMARRAWVERWARERLPAAVSVDQFIIRHQPLETRGGHVEAPARGAEGRRSGRAVAYGQSERRRQRCLITMARRSAVEARTRMLQDVGLTPVYVGSLAPMMGYAFGFESSFAQNRAAGLLLQTEGGQIGLFEQGRMVDLRRLAHMEDPQTVCKEALSHVKAWEAEGTDSASQSEQLPLYVMGKAARAVVGTSYEAGERAMRVVQLFKEGRDSVSVEGEPAGVPGIADGPAVGLAASVLYNTGDALNLLAPDAAQAVRDEREKRDALRVILGVGVAVLVLWMSITGATFWLRHQVEEAEGALAQAEDRIARVEEAEAALRSMQANLAHARRLAKSRTRAAAVLAHISRQVPPDLWLREVILEAGATEPGTARSQGRQPGNPATIMLRGWALTEEAPGTFVAALEVSAGLQDVRPIYVERLSAQEVARRSRKVWQRPLHQFEVHVQALLADKHVTQE